jgi:hypothetical protein
MIGHNAQAFTLRLFSGFLVILSPDVPGPAGIDYHTIFLFPFLPVLNHMSGGGSVAMGHNYFKSGTSQLFNGVLHDLVKMEHLLSDTAQWPLAVSGRDPRLYASAEQGQKAVEYQLTRMAKLLRKSLDTLK